MCLCILVVIDWCVLVQLVYGLFLSLVSCFGSVCSVYWVDVCSFFSLLWWIGIDIGSLVCVCIEYVVIVFVLWLLCRQLMKIFFMWFCGLILVIKWLGKVVVMCCIMVCVKVLSVFQLVVLWCVSGIIMCMLFLLLVFRNVFRLSLLSSVSVSCVVLIICVKGNVGFGLILKMMWLGCLMWLVSVFYVWNFIVFICIVLIRVFVELIVSSDGCFGLSDGFSCVMFCSLSVVECFWKKCLLLMLLGVCISDVGWLCRCGSIYLVMFV